MDTGLAFLIVGTLVTLAVEWIRSVATGVDGRLVNILAWAVGFAATFIPASVVEQFTFSGLDLENRLLTGAILAGVASVIAEAKGALNNSRKITAEVLLEAGEEAYGGGSDDAAPR
jgi:hypothetical protein